MSGAPKISDAMRQMLVSMPDRWERWHSRRGMPFLLLNPTIEALKKRGLVQIKTIPPRWRRTAAGRRAALAREGGA